MRNHLCSLLLMTMLLSCTEHRAQEPSEHDVQVETQAGRKDSSGLSAQDTDASRQVDQQEELSPQDLHVPEVTDAKCSVGSCDDNLYCTADYCSEHGCEFLLRHGFCLIDGACIKDGDQHTNHPCEICDPMNDPTGWTLFVSSACQNWSCPEGDAKCCECTPKRCGETPCGTVCPCDDGLWCTVDICTEGVCVSPELKPDTCLIYGICHGNGAHSPSNSCMACRPELSTSSWSKQPEGATCNTGYCKSGFCCSQTPTQCENIICGCDEICGDCWALCEPPDWLNDPGLCCLQVCGASCCALDEDCGAEQRCVYFPDELPWVDISLGRCVPRLTQPDCWLDTDCDEGYRCLNPIFCQPCDADCPALAPGICTLTE